MAEWTFCNSSRRLSIHAWRVRGGWSLACRARAWARIKSLKACGCGCGRTVSGIVEVLISCRLNHTPAAWSFAGAKRQAGLRLRFAPGEINQSHDPKPVT